MSNDRIPCGNPTAAQIRSDRQAARTKPPAELDRIANAVLAYRPKAKTSKAKKRQRARRKIQERDSCI